MKKIMELLDEAVERCIEGYVVCYTGVYNPSRKRELRIFDLENGKVVMSAEIEDILTSAAFYKGELYLGTTFDGVEVWKGKKTIYKGGSMNQLFTYRGALWGLTPSRIVKLSGRTFFSREKKISNLGEREARWISFKGRDAYIQYGESSGTLVISKFDFEKGEILDEICREEWSDAISQFEFVNKEWIITCGSSAGLVAYNTESGERVEVYKRSSPRFLIKEREEYVEIIASESGVRPSYLILIKSDEEFKNVDVKRIKVDVEYLRPLLLASWELIKMLEERNGG